MSMAEFTGQTYGEGARQQASQRMVRPGPPPTEGGMPQITPMGAPTERPDEPVTAGIPLGGGPGPGAIAPIGIQPGSKEDLVLKMRAMVSKYPNSTLIALLEHLESM